jgi:hypothetical protein
MNLNGWDVVVLCHQDIANRLLSTQTLTPAFGSDPKHRRRA